MLLKQDRAINARLIEDFQSTRQRTEAIFNCLTPEAYTVRPIPLRHPFVFYDGHMDAFIWNTLFRRTLGKPAMNPELDTLFERGIDPASAREAQAKTIPQWPERSIISAYKDAISQQLGTFLEEVDLLNPPHPALEHGQMLYLLLEHEWMHQETLIYILHQLDPQLKTPPPDYQPMNQHFTSHPDSAPTPYRIEIPEGNTTLGASPQEYPFVWDNEQAAQEITVPGFSMDAYNITQGGFLSFVEAGGYDQKAFWSEAGWAWKESKGIQHPHFWERHSGQWYYRGVFETVPLPLAWPVMVTYAEADAYARFVGASLPTEAQWHRAAYGENVHWRYPWHPSEVSGPTGNVDFKHWNPLPVGQDPTAVSPMGVYDLWSNGWEWTQTAFAPLPGFVPSAGYPQYSADFFDGKHRVLKGGSWVTDARLLRRSFRNWFYEDYPYHYATFRCVH
jgi:ergothioneine biosynthesis protein EgtB